MLTSEDGLKLSPAYLDEKGMTLTDLVSTAIGLAVARIVDGKKALDRAEADLLSEIDERHPFMVSVNAEGGDRQQVNGRAVAPDEPKARGNAVEKPVIEDEQEIVEEVKNEPANAKNAEKVTDTKKVSQKVDELRRTWQTTFGDRNLLFFSPICAKMRSLMNDYFESLLQAKGEGAPFDKCTPRQLYKMIMGLDGLKRSLRPPAMIALSVKRDIGAEVAKMYQAIQGENWGNALQCLLAVNELLVQSGSSLRADPHAEAEEVDVAVLNELEKVQTTVNDCVKAAGPRLLSRLVADEMKAVLQEIDDLIEKEDWAAAETKANALADMLGDPDKYFNGGVSNSVLCDLFRGPFEEYVRKTLDADELSKMELSRTVEGHQLGLELDGATTEVSTRLHIDATRLTPKRLTAALKFLRAFDNGTVVIQQSWCLDSVPQVTASFVRALEAGRLDELTDEGAFFLMEILTLSALPQNDGVLSYCQQDCNVLLDTLQAAGLKLNEICPRNFNPGEVNYKSAENTCEKFDALYVQNRDSFADFQGFLQRTYGKSFSAVEKDDVEKIGKLRAEKPIDPLLTLSTSERRALDLLRGQTSGDVFAGGGTARKEEVLTLLRALKNFKNGDVRETAVTLAGQSVTLVYDGNGVVTVQFRTRAYATEFRPNPDPVECRLPIDVHRLVERLANDIVTHPALFGHGAVLENLPQAGDVSPKAREQYVRVLVAQYKIEPSVLALVPVATLDDLAHAPQDELAFEARIKPFQPQVRQDGVDIATFGIDPLSDKVRKEVLGMLSLVRALLPVNSANDGGKTLAAKLRDFYARSAENKALFGQLVKNAHSLRQTPLRLLIPGLQQNDVEELQADLQDMLECLDADAPSGGVLDAIANLFNSRDPWAEKLAKLAGGSNDLTPGETKTLAALARLEATLQGRAVVDQDLTQIPDADVPDAVLFAEALKGHAAEDVRKALLPAQDARDEASVKVFRNVVARYYGIEAEQLVAMPPEELAELAHGVATSGNLVKPPATKVEFLAKYGAYLPPAPNVMSAGATELVKTWENASEEDKARVTVLPPKANPKETEREAKIREVHAFFADLVANEDMISRDRTKGLAPGVRIARVFAERAETLKAILDDVTLLDELDPSRFLKEQDEADEMAENPFTAFKQTFAELAGGPMKNLSAASLRAMFQDAERKMDLPRAELQNLANSNPLLGDLDPDKRGATIALRLMDVEKQIDAMSDSVLEVVQEKLTEQVTELYNRLRASGDKDLAVWEKSLAELSQGAVMDPDHGFGPFLEQVLKTYFEKMDPLDRRTTLAAMVRHSANAKSMGQVLGAMFKGTGPLFQKLLQGLPADQFPDEDMQAALKDLKSRLAPIPETYVKAQMLQIVQRSEGAITSITVVRSLGAASVGQAFLCRAVTREHPEGVEIVVKILRPDAESRILREQEIFIAAAKQANMSATYDVTLDTIKGEFDFTSEYANILEGDVYDQKYDNTVHSMKASSLSDPSMGVIVLEKAPGENVSDYVEDVRRRVVEILAELKKEDENVAYETSDPARFVALRSELKALYLKLHHRQGLLQHLVSAWTDEAFFGSGFFHGDLHAGNIMIDDNQVTVIDFGNVTKLSSEDRSCFMNLVAHVQIREPDSFLSTFSKLLDPGSKAKLNDPQLKASLLGDLTEILNAGASNKDICSRIFAAISAFQSRGLEIPSSMYKFIQCMIRLKGTVDSMSEALDEISRTIDRIDLQSSPAGSELDLPWDPEDLKKLNDPTTSDDDVNAILGRHGQLLEDKIFQYWEAHLNDDFETLEETLVEPVRQFLKSVCAPELANELGETIWPLQCVLDTFDRSKKYSQHNARAQLDGLRGGYIKLRKMMLEMIAGSHANVKTQNLAAPADMMDAIGEAVQKKLTRCAAQMGFFNGLDYSFKQWKNRKTEAEINARAAKSRDLRSQLVTSGKIAPVTARLLGDAMDHYFLIPNAFRATLKSPGWAHNPENAKLAVRMLFRNFARLRKAAGANCPSFTGEPGVLQYVLTHFKTLCPEFEAGFASLTPQAYQNLHAAATELLEASADKAEDAQVVLDVLAALDELAGLA